MALWLKLIPKLQLSGSDHTSPDHSVLHMRKYLRSGGRIGGNNGGGWNGGNNGGGNSITVFADSDYRGASRTFRGEQYNLSNTGFNDQISSIRLNGSWEVCSDSGFRGYCQVIEGNVRNLNNTGLTDRISSMRPLRGGGRY